jgi:sarcosine oxidase subunit beta
VGDEYNTDVVVVGAGISGAAAALELAQSGLRVVLLDRWGPAAMASGWTLAGVRQSGRHPAELPLATAAVRLWEGLGERLGADVRYRQEGNLRLARNEAEVPVIEALVAEQAAAGLDVVLLRGAEVQAVAPAVNPTVLAACHCASDGHADPVATVTAFVDAGVRAGVATRFGERALAIETEGGRVVAVRTDKGRIGCGHVVLAAGVFGNELLEPIGSRVPLEVQMVAAMRSAPLPPVLRQVIGVANADCAGRQQADGCFRVTSGVQPFTGRLVEGERPAVLPPASALRMLVDTFGTAVPAFADAPIAAVWAGLIDLTPDALPVLDRVPGAEGLVVAMGFSGHGFGIGPITGQIMAGMVRDEPSGFDLTPFRLARFDGWNAPAEPVTLHG